MKHLLTFLGACSLLALTIAGVSQANKPTEESLMITVTRKSADEARDTCERWKKNAGGVVGHISVFDSADEMYSVPCRTLIEQK